MGLGDERMTRVKTLLHLRKPTSCKMKVLLHEAFCSLLSPSQVMESETTDGQVERLYPHLDVNDEGTFASDRLVRIYHGRGLVVARLVFLGRGRYLSRPAHDGERSHRPDLDLAVVTETVFWVLEEVMETVAWCWQI